MSEGRRKFLKGEAAALLEHVGMMQLREFINLFLDIAPAFDFEAERTIEQLLEDGAANRRIFDGQVYLVSEGHR